MCAIVLKGKYYRLADIDTLSNVVALFSVHRHRRLFIARRSAKYRPAPNQVEIPQGNVLRAGAV
jgi:hypothetical protein